MAAANATLGGLPLVAWNHYASWVEGAEEWVVPGLNQVIDINIFDVLNAVAAGVALRGFMGHRYHWIRAFWLTWAMTSSGSTLNAIFAGRKMPWLVNAYQFPSLAVGYWLAFHCPGA